MKYFLHDSSSFEDEKVSILFMEYGYEGLGLFYTILEKLAKQEKPVNTKVLKMQLKVGKKLEKCWSFMEEIDLLSSNNGETFNKRLLKFGESMDKKRENTSKRVSQHRANQSLNDNVTCYNDVTNAPNLTKHNLTKEDTKVSPNGVVENFTNHVEEKIKKETSPKVAPKGSPPGFEFDIELPFRSAEFAEAWSDWAKFRNEIRKKLPESTARKQIEQLSAVPEQTAIAMINQSIEKGWTGLFDLKVERKIPQPVFVEEKGKIQQSLENNMVAMQNIRKRRELEEQY